MLQQHLTTPDTRDMVISTERCHSGVPLCGDLGANCFKITITECCLEDAPRCVRLAKKRRKLLVWENYSHSSMRQHHEFMWDILRMPYIAWGFYGFVYKNSAKKNEFPGPLWHATETGTTVRNLDSPTRPMTYLHSWISHMGNSLAAWEKTGGVIIAFRRQLCLLTASAWGFVGDVDDIYDTVVWS